MALCAKTTFFRDRDLPGVEVRKVTDAYATGDLYCSDFEFFAPETWCAEVAHRRLTSRLERGSLLCARPGDVFSVKKVWLGGCHRSLLIEPEPWAAWLGEAGIEAPRPELPPFVTMSDRLSCALARVFTGFERRRPVSELRAKLSAFLALASGELDVKYGEPLAATPTGVYGPAHPESAASEVIERIRRELEGDPRAPVDLGRLAREAGMSRFQLLRAFKRRFGLPPREYRLRVRLGLVQRALRRGEKPATVAVNCGFFDQAHLARHFRRHVGVNPGEYSRAASAPAESREAETPARCCGSP